MQKTILTFSVTSDFSQLQKLPNLNQWIVHEDEKLMIRKLPSYIRSKSFMGLNKVSSFKCRQVSITKNGLLIVYEKESEGYVLNIREAESISTITENGKNRRKHYRRCHLKLRYPFGTLNLLIISNEISQWKQAICGIYEERVHEKSDASTVVEIIDELESKPDMTETDYETTTQTNSTDTEPETKLSNIYSNEFIFFIDLVIT